LETFLIRPIPPLAQEKSDLDVSQGHQEGTVSPEAGTHDSSHAPLLVCWIQNRPGLFFRFWCPLGWIVCPVFNNSCPQNLRRHAILNLLPCVRIREVYE
jgi:hypothetical protein